MNSQWLSLQRVMGKLSSCNFDYSPTLFCKVDSSPMVFYIAPHQSKVAFRRFVEKGGGLLEFKATDESIKLLWPGVKALSDEMIAVEFIFDSIENNKLEDIANYRVSRGMMYSNTSDKDLRPLQSKKDKGRSEYLLEEDEKLLKYLMIKDRHLLASGISVWKKAEKLKVTKHTWQSMRTRYLRHVLPNIRSYSCLDSDTIKIFESSIPEKTSPKIFRKRKFLEMMGLEKNPFLRSDDSFSLTNNQQMNLRDKDSNSGGNVGGKVLQNVENDSLSSNIEVNSLKVCSRVTECENSDMESVYLFERLSRPNEKIHNRNTEENSVNNYDNNNSSSNDNNKNLTKLQIVPLVADCENSDAETLYIFERSPLPADYISNQNFENKDMAGCEDPNVKSIDFVEVSLESEPREMFNLADKDCAEDEGREVSGSQNSKSSHDSDASIISLSRRYMNKFLKDKSLHGKETSAQSLVQRLPESDSRKDLKQPETASSYQIGSSSRTGVGSTGLVQHPKDFANDMNKLELALKWLDVPPWVLNGALYFNNGDLDDAVYWLLHSSTKSGAPIFTHKDDRLLMEASDVQLETLKQKYGAKTVRRRLEFLKQLSTNND